MIKTTMDPITITPAPKGGGAHGGDWEVPGRGDICLLIPDGYFSISGDTFKETLGHDKLSQESTNTHHLS